jgi:ribosomal protein L32
MHSRKTHKLKDRELELITENLRFSQLQKSSIFGNLHRSDPVCPKCGSHTTTKYVKAIKSLIRTIQLK